MEESVVMSSEMVHLHAKGKGAALSATGAHVQAHSRQVLCSALFFESGEQRTSRSSRTPRPAPAACASAREGHAPAHTSAPAARGAKGKKASSQQ